MKYEAHEYANLFPMMTALELDALSEDVKANGLRHPVVMYGDKVLDGRNRLKACEMAKVEPTFTEHEGDEVSALALVISLNVQRRDLTAAQRAIVAARALPPYEEAAKRRMADGAKKKGKGVTAGDNPHRSADDVAKVFKVGINAVSQAKTILKEAPDLAAEVELCALSLAGAYEKLQGRREEEKVKLAAAAQKAKELERAEKYREAISNGEMTLDEALLKIQREAEEEEERRRQEEEDRLHDASARRIWRERAAETLAAVKSWFAAVSDADLRWRRADGVKAPFTPDDLDAAAGHLRRAAQVFREMEE